MRRIAAVAVAVAAVGLTACGSDKESSGTSTAPSSAQRLDPHRMVDLQSHRGGRGLLVEESLAAYAHSIEIGVSTLELDIVLTADKAPLIWHDPVIQAEKCADTAPAFPGDPKFPYVGKLVHELTYDQVRTLDCNKTLPKFPEQQPVPGNKIAKLPELFDLVKSYPGAFEALRYNIETKIEAEHPEQSATPQEFVDIILDEVNKAAATDKTEIQSFDWSSLPLVKAKNPAIPTVALYDNSTFTPHSRWLGPIHYEDHKADPLAAVKALGADIASPSYVEPWDTDNTFGSPGFKMAVTTTDVQKAHNLGLKIIPWSINDKPAIAAQIDTGVDGIITDYPNRMREVMQEKGLPLPPAFHK
ncbi:glycerophosphodiester phosphodiesterase family protein [Nocardia terpenica]|uniref:Glycerophosphodiester phosphodiesterase n=1 Tax=Nocardia terpenica TaxID=455432 RepID=A0A161XEA6_9NOCA|nr:glycerophosphodiester phosphodiesterase [Nocardia terpenica]NQE90915.1 glycerophosphodiester phosphodiesterase [Nocardia terpenica]